MAMTMSGDVQLAANREVVWAKLNDPTVLKSCIPGCELLEKNSENEFQAVVKTQHFPDELTLMPRDEMKVSASGGELMPSSRLRRRRSRCSSRSSS